MKLWEYIKTSMLKYPYQTVCENGAEITYENLVIWAELFARKLRGLNCCAILCNSEIAAAMAMLGCFAAEVTATPLSVRYGELHCNKILDTVSPDAVITDQGGEINIRYITNSGYIVPEEHPALIMCTSGTTGKPKGVMLSESNIVANIGDIADYFNINESDTILISRPLYHCAVLTGEFLTALVKGSRIRFYSETFNPPKILELFKEYRITAFCGTPTLLSMTAHFKGKSENDCLKHICISGECMDIQTGNRIARAFPKCEIYHIYGLTEACPRVSYLPPNLFNRYPDCVGIPLKSVSVRLADKNGNPLPDGKEGILWVKGDNIMLGYYNEPDKTAEVLRDGWLCTGDIAVINDVGLLKIKGRSDGLIIKSGMNIYPAEIEAALKADPRVKEVLAYGIEGKHGMHIGLKIAGDFNSVSEVKKLCSECLPYFQIPNYIEIFPELPKNASGKIARRI